MGKMFSRRNIYTIAVMVEAEGIFENLTSLIYWQKDNTL